MKFKQGDLIRFNGEDNRMETGETDEDDDDITVLTFANGCVYTVGNTDEGDYADGCYYIHCEAEEYNGGWDVSWVEDNFTAVKKNWKDKLED